MATPKSTRGRHIEPPLLIPRHVKNLNAIAERAGLSVSCYVDHYDDEPDEFKLFVDWTGSLDQLFATSLIPRHLQRRLGFAVKETNALVPTDTAWWAKPLLDLRVSSGEEGTANVELCFGEVPQQIVVSNEVEVARCATGSWHHGSADALIASGFVPRERLPMGKRSTRTSGPWEHIGGKTRYKRHWTSRRQPDGFYTYWEQSEIDFASQEQKRARQEAAQTAAAPDASMSDVERDWHYAQGYASAWASRLVFDESVVDAERAAAIREFYSLIEGRRGVFAFLQSARDWPLSALLEGLRGLPLYRVNRPALRVIKGGAV